MRRSLGLAIRIAALPSIALVMVACNALTGASSLATCEGCGDLAAPDRVDATSGGDAPGIDPPDGGSKLPLMCTGDETACEGKTAAKCVDGAWQRTPCADLCTAGMCDSLPSCRNPAGTGCGASASPTSCCATSPVPGGTFNRRNAPSSSATVSAFELDRYEVTVGRMRAFVDAGGVTQAAPPAVGTGAHPKIANSGWQPAWNAFLPATVAQLRSSFNQTNPTWTDTAGANEHLPINNVTWFLAFAFCAWDSARLPTFAEMSFAAVGGSEQRYYPWSSPPADTSITPTRAAYDCGFIPPAKNCPASYCSDNSSSPCNALTCFTPNTCVNPGCTGCTFSDIAPVGSLATGAGRWGHFDLAGNMAELVLDDDKPGLPNPCVDCAALPPSVLKGGGQPRLDAELVTVGGGWDYGATSMRNTSYGTVKDDDVASAIGFRCAR